MRDFDQQKIEKAGGDRREREMAILEHQPDHPEQPDFTPSESAAASLADAHTMEALTELLTMLEHK